VLDPDVVLRADRTAVATSHARASAGAPRLAPEIRGAAAVANTFKGRAAAAQLALIEGEAGLVWAPAGRPVVAFDFVVANGLIVALSLSMDPRGPAAPRVRRA